MRQIALTAALLLAAPAFAQEQVAALTQTIPASLDPVMRMTVGVRLNGQGPYDFVVDTGADRSVVSDVVAAELHLPASRRATLHSLTGITAVDMVSIDTLQTGGRTVTGVRAPVLREGNLGASGLLGIDALVDQRVTMDFKAGTMSVRPSEFREPRDGPDTIVVRAKRRFGQLVLIDASIKGRRIYAIIDSGAQTTVANSALRKLMATRKAGTEIGTVMLKGVTGASVSGQMGFIPDMKIGGLSLYNTQVAFSDVHPFKRYGLERQPALLIGTDVLRLFERVSLDFKSKKVKFLIDGETMRSLPNEAVAANGARSPAAGRKPAAL